MAPASSRRPAALGAGLLWTMLLLLPLGMYYHHVSDPASQRDCTRVGTCSRAGPGSAKVAGRSKPVALPYGNDEEVVRLPSVENLKPQRQPQPLQLKAPLESSVAQKHPPPPKKAETPKAKYIVTSQQLAALAADKCSVDWTRAVEVGLANWLETGISEVQLDELCRRKAMRVSIRSGNELRHMAWNLPGMNLHRVASAMWLLQLTADRAVQRGIPLPDVELMLQPGDGSFSTAMPMMQWVDAGPLLSNIKCAGDASVSFPFTFHDQFGEGTGAMGLEIWDARSKQLSDWGDGPWDGKNNSLFFSAGYGAAVRGNRSHLFDTGSAYVTALDKGRPLSEYGKYRYLVYAYGHCGWSRRLHELAFMDTVVFMEDSTCREFMHYAFDEDTDFIAVREDFSDLRVKLEALIKTPDKARAMAARWVSKGRAAMSLTCTLDYIETLVRRYARLQRFTPPPRPDWPVYPRGSNQQHFRDAGRVDDEVACPPRSADNTHHFERSHVC